MRSKQRAALGWPSSHVVPDRLPAGFQEGRRPAEAKCNSFFSISSVIRVSGEFERRNTRIAVKLVRTRDQAVAAAAEKREAVSTRKASLLALEAIAPALPEIIGGSADLTGSNYTKWSKTGPLRPDHLDGRHINYGVREFGMCAISSGISVHGVPAFAGTFLTCSYYARNALRWPR